ncbi:MAG: kelch repeat-containing protein [Planctomycetota bacterium]
MRVSNSIPFVVALAAALPSQTWAPITTTTVPSVRRAGAMAFDGVNNRLIMYGGSMPSPSAILNETWSYNGQWTQLAPAGGALGRWGHRLVRDTVSNRLVTFGGRSPVLNGFANDTYTWNGSVWTAQPTVGAPSSRYLYGMCYDSTRNVIVLFGGRTATQTLGDTWELALQGTTYTWTQKMPALAPAPREEMVMVYDAGFARTLLFGGYNSTTNTLFGDTWQYTGTQWTNITPSSGPSPRYRTSYAYDSVRQRPLMYGGYDGAQVLTETREWNGSEWILIATGAGNLQATEQYAGYDPVRRKFVTFGGVGTVFSNQTFEYTGSTAGLFSLFGAGCATGSGVSQITAALPPTLGQTLALTFTNIPTTPGNAYLMLVALGLSNTTWQGLPLPFDLAAIGLGGCQLVVAADLLRTSAVAAGPTVPFAVSIPNQAALLNMSFYLQGVITQITPTNIGFIGASRGGRALIGN